MSNNRDLNAAPQERPRRSLTLVETTALGCTSGAVGAVFEQPLYNNKVRAQDGLALSKDPRVLFRGLATNATSMVPITGIQVGLTVLIQRSYFQKEEKDLTSTEKTLSAFTAGLGSALFSCPAELIMNHQGKTGFSFSKTISSMQEQGGWRSLWRGLPATAQREGVFTTFFMAARPSVEKKIGPYVQNDFLTPIFAGMLCGFASALLTQPVDTAKTRQQSEVLKEVISLKEAVTRIYKADGYLGFFAGTRFRLGQVAVTLGAMAGALEYAKKEIEKRF